MKPTNSIVKHSNKNNNKKDW